MYLITKGNTNHYSSEKFCVMKENKLQDFIDKFIGKEEEKVEIIDFNEYIKTIKDWKRGPIDDSICKDSKHLFFYDLNDENTIHCIGHNGNDFFNIERIAKFEDI
jgi:hypothetical protein